MSARHAPAAPRWTDEGEERLLALLRGGDPGGFEELVRTTAPRLLAVTRRLLRSEEEARDALQDTYLAAFRSLAGFSGRARLSTWLHRIAVNAALMKLRSRTRHPEAPIDELLPQFDATGHRVIDERPELSALQQLERSELRAAVRRCIDRLPERHRTVLLLRDVEELEADEVAEALALSSDALKMRLHRARQALRTLLQRELSQEDSR